MIKKNLNSSTRILKTLMGFGLIGISLAVFNPQYYLILFVIQLIGFWNVILGFVGWSPIYSMLEKSDFPLHLNKFSKKEMQDALK
ncbi:MAG: DUF2892 domain-containing protein [Nanoarchaeales archaeon]|nr:DUF2892 domain-containing protein [Nanoarchaeales archaeon]